MSNCSKWIYIFWKNNAQVRGILQMRSMNNIGSFLRNHRECHIQKTKKGKCSNFQKRKTESAWCLLSTMLSSGENRLYTFNLLSIKTVIAYIFHFLFFYLRRFGRQGLFHFSKVYNKLPHGNLWDGWKNIPDNKNERRFQMYTTRLFLHACPV